MELGKTLFSMSGSLNLGHLGLDKSLFWETVLCLVGCLAAALASIHEMPVAATKFHQILSNVPLETKPFPSSPTLESHCSKSCSPGLHKLKCAQESPGNTFRRQMLIQ